MAKALLTTSDLAAIEAAVRAAEENTSGEIYCIVAEESSEDLLIPLAWATGVALLAPAILLLAGLPAPALDPAAPGGWPTGWSVLPTTREAAVHAARVGTLVFQAALFVSVLTIASITPIRRLLTPKAFKRERVRQRAETQFLAHNLSATRDRTGVLIYVSAAEHMAELIADEGINAKVEPGTWDRAMQALIGGLKSGEPGEGFIAAIGLCGGVLAEHFPPRPLDNPNELPDAVVLLPSS